MGRLGVKENVGACPALLPLTLCPESRNFAQVPLKPKNLFSAGFMV
jgi:hypothetical protein